MREALDLDALNALLTSIFESPSGSARQAVLSHAHSANALFLQDDEAVLVEAVAALCKTKADALLPTYVVSDSARIAEMKFAAAKGFEQRAFLADFDNRPSNIVVVFDFFENLHRFVAALDKGAGHRILFPSVKFSRPFSSAKYVHFDHAAYKTLIDSKARFGRFDYPDCEQITQVINFCRDIPGDYVEIGVYKGRSAFAATRYMFERAIAKKIYLLDTYEGFNYAAAQNSWDAGWSGGHGDQSEQAINALLKDFPGVRTIKNNIIEDPFPAEIGPLAVANIDVDMYEAVKAGLEKTAPLISKGGVIICEDAGHRHVGGAYIAMREFLDGGAGARFRPLHLYSGQFLLIKDA